MGIIWENAAFLVESIKDGSILAATVVGVSGGIWSSGKWFDWVVTSVCVGHLVNVVGGSTIRTAASVLPVITGDSDAIVFFSKVTWVAWL